MSLNRQLPKSAQFIVSSTGAVAGTTAVNFGAVDTTGYAGMTFLALLGTLTATQVTSLKAQWSDDNSTWTDVTGAVTAAAADADGGKLLILSVYKPRHRYYRGVLNRGTANAVLTAGLTVLHLPTFQPIAQDASVSQAAYLDNPI